MDSYGTKNTCIRWDCRSAPTGEYDGFIFAAAVMWPVAVAFFRNVNIGFFDKYMFFS